MKVVHVAEAWGGGVQRVVSQYLALTPEFQHIVLARPRGGVPVPTLTSAPVQQCGEGLVSFLTGAARRIRAEHPDVVHLHSSWAGLLRALPLRGVRVVYTPHAFSFLREDVPPAVRLAFLGTEGVLARRSVIAGCSPYECIRARALGATALHLPPPAPGPSITAPGGGVSRRIVTMGRVCPQKDPAFFAEVAGQARSVAPDLSFTWIGDGDPQAVALLRRAGVRVTGWLDPQRARAELAAAQLYVHTALWEGTPLAWVEAAGCGLPILIRSRPYAVGLGLEQGGVTPQELLRGIREAVTPARRAELLASSRRFANQHREAVTRAAVLAAYAA